MEQQSRLQDGAHSHRAWQRNGQCDQLQLVFLGAACAAPPSGSGVHPSQHAGSAVRKVCTWEMLTTMNTCFKMGLFACGCCSHAWLLLQPISCSVADVHAIANFKCSAGRQSGCPLLRTSWVAVDQSPSSSGTAAAQRPQCALQRRRRWQVCWFDRCSHTTAVPQLCRSLLQPTCLLTQDKAQ